MKIPIATYRIQFHVDFGFAAADSIMSYLSDLNISDIYASPIFKARKGSRHGYDIVDPTRINPELGSISEFENLADTLQHARMGWIQDMVPNHSAFDSDNILLMDVLEKGPRSLRADYFDIIWDHPVKDLNRKVSAPFLSDHYGNELENGAIRLAYGPEGFTLAFDTFVFPVNLECYGLLIKHILDMCSTASYPDPSECSQLADMLDQISTAPITPSSAHKIKSALWNLYSLNSTIHRCLDTCIEELNGRTSFPETFNRLDDLLESQWFRLSYWKTATDEINYRRFFNINELICWRTQQQEVAEHIHKLIFRLIKNGKITGLRIDHIDGLYHPENYLKWLSESVHDTYIIVEKILGPKEMLPDSWPVQGTTGYDFLSQVNRVFCRPDTGKEMSRIYNEFTGQTDPWPDLVRRNKQKVIDHEMSGDLDNLSVLLKQIASCHRHGKDFTYRRLRKALALFTACFPVYRTYRSDDICAPVDQRHLQSALDIALKCSPDLRRELDFLYTLMVSENDRQAISFVMRYQQFMAPVMAKGLEDTALYGYNRLLSLNDVGTDPDSFGCHLDSFHEELRHRASRWPHTLNTTSTHDTKRGEDIRCRLNVLSEIPREWEKVLKKWSGLNAVCKTRINGISAPDSNEEYYIYQTLVGAYPIDGVQRSGFVQRLKDHIVKSIREAKVHSSWLEPDLSWESSCIRFIERILANGNSNVFLSEFKSFSEKIASFGIWNSLSQLLIKITAPGVPDFYQGTELWDLNLTDPDNRRPVDYRIRKSYLTDIRKKAESNRTALIDELMSGRTSGKIKLFVMVNALEVRQVCSNVFQSPGYIPLNIIGKHARHIIAFARVHEGQWCLTIVPRFLTSLINKDQLPLGRQIWHDTEIILPSGAPQLWNNELTSESIEGNGSILAADCFKRFPVCLLTG